MTQQVLLDYTKAYQKLYQRHPSELRGDGDGWVIVNGARMTVHELQAITEQLHREIIRSQAEKRSIVKRLLKWFSTPTP
jgi:hypothetical protein